MLDLIFISSLRRLGGLLETFPAGIVFPTVVGAADALIVHATEGERCRPMRTVFSDEAVPSFCVAVDDKFFAENFDRPDGLLIS